MKTFKLLFLLISPLYFLSSDLPSYKVYKADGKQTDFEAVLNDALKADVVLFGELHNNAIAHWLQLELTKAIYDAKGKALVLGAEMFEADDQLKIDEYFKGLISQKYFEEEARLWNNYKTDYKPLLEFAKEKDLGFVATNIPRRYASLVSRKGLDSLELLSKEALKFVAPLPVKFDETLPGYQEMSGMSGHGMQYIAQGQAVKDATMAYFIAENHKKGHVFLHFNGAYHSNNYEGISWYLKEYNKKLKILTISTIEQDNVDELTKDNIKLADYIIVVDSDVTKTY